MCPAKSDFAFGVEMECLTVVPECHLDKETVIHNFFANLAKQAPSLGAYRGVFNAYGRCYFDVGHVELATSECASPYVLPSIVDRIQAVAARSVAALERSGTPMILANNNHSGLLAPECSVWGTHENYLVEKRPEPLGDLILPFLTSRIYAGAGGVLFPNGDYLAGVRPNCMAVATGGGTTDCRAIHCTVGRPHHAETRPRRYRYHLISGDGHRSQFNWSLQIGATALAVKAVLYDAETRAAAIRLRVDQPAGWVTLLKRNNLLAKAGQPLRVAPEVISTQRMYLDGARRFAGRLETSPDWIPRLLNDWENTLDAYQRMDRAWLAARMDAFAKYELFSAVLQDAGCDWSVLRNHADLFPELALLNQNYHEFCNRDSAFTRLANAGLLQHRVALPVEPGDEPDPYVPNTGTRAAVRARFIKAHDNASNLIIDWTHVHDTTTGKYRRLASPFATEYGPWQGPEEPVHRVRGRPEASGILDQVLHNYDRGMFNSARLLLDRYQRFLLENGGPQRQDRTVQRYQAWLRPRLGDLDGPELLNHVHGDDRESWISVGDHCNVLRFTGISPDLERMRPWIERGLHLLRSVDPQGMEPTEGPIIRGHIAATLAAAGQLEHAREILNVPGNHRGLFHHDLRIRARLVAVRGEIQRKMGRRARAARLLRVAHDVQHGREYYGQLVNYTIPCLAKCAEYEDEARMLLDEADDYVANNSDTIGKLRIDLLRCRIVGDGPCAAQTHMLVDRLRHELPALRTCRVTNQIADNWDAWIAGGMPAGEHDPFWGV